MIEQVIRRSRAAPEECCFWATHGGAELDLLLVHEHERRRVEVKLTTAPRITKSIRLAREALRLDRLDVIHAGDSTFDMGDGIRSLAFADLE